MMKRYMDLILAILEYIECDGNGRLLCPPEVKGYTPQQVEYHVELCAQAGFIKVSDKKRDLIRSLTWQGHEELERLKSS